MKVIKKLNEIDAEEGKDYYVCVTPIHGVIECVGPGLKSDYIKKNKERYDYMVIYDERSLRYAYGSHVIVSLEGEWDEVK